MNVALRRIVTVLLVSLAASIGGVMAAAVAPQDASADTNINYWPSNTVCAGCTKWTDVHGGYPARQRFWASVYNNGGSWSNIFTYASTYSPVTQGSTSGNPVHMYNPHTNVWSNAGCWNRNQVNVIASCWSTHP